MTNTTEDATRHTLRCSLCDHETGPCSVPAEAAIELAEHVCSIEALRLAAARAALDLHGLDGLPAGLASDPLAIALDRAMGERGLDYRNPLDLLEVLRCLLGLLA